MKKRDTAPLKGAWQTAPISPTCEVLARPGTDNGKHFFCDAPTSRAYPAMGRGWMALCEHHAEKHHPHVTSIEELIESGEKFA